MKKICAFLLIVSSLQMQAGEAFTQVAAEAVAKIAVVVGEAVVKYKIAERERIYAYGAPVTQVPVDGVDKLCDAVFHGMPERVAELLAQKVNVNGVGSARKLTPLMEAVERNDLALVRRLCGLRADLNLTNGAGETALVLAVRKKNLEIVRFLINEEADVTVKSSANESLDQMQTSREIRTLLRQEINKARDEEEEDFQGQMENERQDRARAERRRNLFAREADDAGRHSPVHEGRHRESRNARRYREYGR